MKKIFLLFCLFGAGIAAQAQDGPIGTRSSTDYAPSTSDSRNNGFGVKAGFNLADLRGGDKDAYKNLSSLKTYHAGVYAQFGLNDKVSLQPEVLFTRKGFDAEQFTVQSTTPGQTTGETRETRLDYIQVPVLLVYNIFDNVSVHVGPQVSLLVKAKYAGTERQISSVGLNSLEYGVVGGVEGRVGPARIGARYDLGLADIYNDPKDAGAGAYDNVKNGVFQLYVGFGFNN
ncbi:PorT family protein [Microvirga sp. STR05]|uniref:PorT family protein n=1 Tax=Hymenobacter duratus TaxID=2771356 RepID=A0ABR8JER5_9BACT|nr:porin family protein [Hymenobacter duratus]MBD2714148.1 PorT family protein [Hymenobacter duratus]MBR7949050.1 PorT family protein [Microvirga sp. STR05]